MTLNCVIVQTLSDKARLLARTRINRLGHHVLGKPSFSAAAAANDDESTNPDTVLYIIKLLTAVHISQQLTANK